MSQNRNHEFSANADQDDHQPIKLSEEGAKQFINLLKNPPPPNDALKQAFSRTQRLKANEKENG